MGYSLIPTHSPEKFAFDTSGLLTLEIDNHFKNLEELAQDLDKSHTGTTLPTHSENLDIMRFRRDVLHKASAYGFCFSNNATIGLLYYEPGAYREPHFDPVCNLLIVTIDGNGEYRQYPPNDEVRDSIVFGDIVHEEEADFTIPVHAGDALMTNPYIPHSFKAGDVGRKAIYIGNFQTE